MGEAPDVERTGEGDESHDAGGGETAVNGERRETPKRDGGPAAGTPANGDGGRRWETPANGETPKSNRMASDEPRATDDTQRRKTRHDDKAEIADDLAICNPCAANTERWRQARSANYARLGTSSMSNGAVRVGLTASSHVRAATTGESSA